MIFILWFSVFFKFYIINMYYFWSQNKNGKPEKDKKLTNIQKLKFILLWAHGWISETQEDLKIKNLFLKVTAQNITYNSIWKILHLISSMFLVFLSLGIFHFFL